MKKAISAVVVVTTLSFGLMVSPNYTTKSDQALSKDKNIDQLSLNIEYSTEENIQKQIDTMMRDQHEQSILSISKLNETSSLLTLSDLHDRYKVETVHESVAKDTDQELPDKEYIVDVYMEDTQAPIIEGNDITLAQSADFTIESLGIHAYDVVDGDLETEVIANSVDTSLPGDYSVTVQATDRNELTTKKDFTVSVLEPTTTIVDTLQYVGTPTNYTYVPTPALDRNNLSVRGWKVVADDLRVSDDTIRAYMNDFQNLPGQYGSFLFTTIYIDLSLAPGELGMAYSSGKIVLNGGAYYPTTVLHEATHQLDYSRGFANDPRLIAARNAELNNLPLRYSGNMRDDTYEWVANIVVFYYYDPQTLRTAAPQSYSYVQNVILR